MTWRRRRELGCRRTANTAMGGKGDRWYATAPGQNGQLMYAAISLVAGRGQAWAKHALPLPADWTRGLPRRTRARAPPPVTGTASVYDIRWFRRREEAARCLGAITSGRHRRQTPYYRIAARRAWLYLISGRGGLGGRSVNSCA